MFETVEIDPADAPVVAVLREWRVRAAAGKPAYTVAHNRTLEAIAALRPTSIDELSQVKGVGPTAWSATGRTCWR